MGFQDSAIKLETGLGPNSAGIPYTLLLRLEAIGFPTFGLLLGFGMGGGLSGRKSVRSQSFPLVAEGVVGPTQF